MNFFPPGWPITLFGMFGRRIPRPQLLFYNIVFLKGETMLCFPGGVDGEDVTNVFVFNILSHQ
jgi:hypothetical protein